MMTHECLHEEQLIGQSRVIERLSAELDYKKERLDDLKEDNRRMEGKLDGIVSKLNDMEKTSDNKDAKIEKRLVALETRQAVLEEKMQESKDEDDKKTNRLFTKLALIFSAITIIVSIVFHFI